MSWVSNLLTSSIGKKLVMSFTGLFLISFLIVHLMGNLQLLANDNGKSFNVYAYFMTTNPLVKFISIGLYAGILLHAIQGVLIWLKNKSSKGSKYAVSTNANASFASKNMALLGILIFAFLLIHMGDFWFKMKFTDQLAMVTYEGYDYQVKNLYDKVAYSFSNPLIVGLYLLGLVALGLPLVHGFKSAFQTLGLNHKKYTPFIKTLGLIFSIIVPLIYAVIPVYFFIFKNINT